MHKPNIIVMLIDNLGYGDTGCYGNTVHKTPNIDRLAGEGTRLTSFYSTSGVCTPSRASLMTACYPRRVNLHVGGTGHAVLMPVDPKGLNPDERTMSDTLKRAGYATACVGKWHLGDQDPFLPTRHGFDTFFGCPYSEDMTARESKPHWPPIPLMRNDEVIEAPVDRTYLTRRYTEESIRFIRENTDRPFFLYLAHAMPGSTNRPFASPDFQGRSGNGPYGDAVEELDWSCGEILGTLKELGIDENTIVVWTSDNGAVGWDPPQGSNAPLKGWGYDTSEGGQRVPCIVRWPGIVPAGRVTDEVMTMMDIHPTVAAPAGESMPDDRITDGYDVRPLFSDDDDSRSPYDGAGFFYYHMFQLQAVRSRQWKLYLPLKNKISDTFGDMEKSFESPPALYDVRNDIGETIEVSAEYPKVVERLLALAEKARIDLGDWDREGINQRPAGYVENPTARRLEKAEG